MRKIPHFLGQGYLNMLKSSEHLEVNSGFLTSLYSLQLRALYHSGTIQRGIENT